MMCFWNRKAPISRAAQVVVELLQNPADWTFDQYYATHVRGATIWIGNPTLVWARKAYIPNCGMVVAEGANCCATPDNKAIHRAVFAARDAKCALVAEAYAAAPQAKATHP